MLPIFLNVVFLGICLYFAVRAPHKGYILAIVALSFLIVAFVEFASLAIMNMALGPASRNRMFLVVIYIAIVEELARFVVAVVLFRRYINKGLSYEVFVFAGISFGLYEYIFRLIGFSAAQSPYVCVAGISPILCQNTVALVPFAMHMVAALTYSITIRVRLTYRIPVFLYALLIAITLHSAFNVAAMATPNTAALYNLAVSQLSALLIGLSIGLVCVWVIRRFTVAPKKNDKSDPELPEMQ